MQEMSQVTISNMVRRRKSRQPNDERKAKPKPLFKKKSHDTFSK
jgi:hypothetical protein